MNDPSTELVHTEDCGQVSINISKPGITKGQHWHNSKWELFIVVAGHGLIQERNINTGKMVEWACAQKMGVMTYGTLGGGILTGKYRELKEYGVDDNRNRFYPYFKEPLFSKVMLLLRTMDQISEERNVPLSQIALNWTLQRPFISSCIIGAQSRDKIEENCKVFEWKLSDDEMQLLEQALKKTII